jgi:hypothetical protein
MAPKKASSKATPSVDEAAKAALLAEKKGKALVDTTHQEACEDDALSKRQRNEQPTPESSLRTCSSGGQPQPPPGFAPPEGADATEDGEVIGVSVEEQLQLRALRIKNRNLQKQKEILEAKRQRVSAQAKVRQMIRDEEQRAHEFEQEIALMQREGQLGLQHGPPLQQRAQIEDLFIPQRGHAIPHATAFQGVNYLDERSPLAPHLQVSPWPANFRAGTYPQVQRQHSPSTVYHELSSRRCIIRRGRRHDGQVIHHRPRRPSPHLVHQVAPAVHRLLEKSPGQIPAQLPRVPPRHRRLGRTFTLQAAGKRNSVGVLPQVSDSQVTAAFG